MLDFLKFFLFDDEGFDFEGLFMLGMLATLIALPICVIVRALLV